MTRRFLALASLLLASSALAATSSETIVNQVKFPALDTDHAVHVSNVTLKAGPATITLADGTLFPGTAVGDRPVEAVFIGRGSFAIKPDDPVEAGQLELFTSSRELNEAITEAIFVAPAAEMMATLTKGTPASDAAATTRARSLFGDWKSGVDRKLLHVDSRLLGAALGDENGTSYFAARLHGVQKGDFDYEVDPHGGAAIGQFIPLDLTEREKRRAAGQLNKEHRHGRALGTEVTDLGYFNTWSALGTAPAEGDFEPETYHVDATIADGVERLGGRATIDLRAVRGSRRVVSLELHQDQQVSQVTDGAGAPLPFVRSGYQVAVVLPQAPEAGTHFSITVAFDGTMFDKEGRDFRLRDTQNWYPHAGVIDRAKYEVTLHWPAGIDVLSAGKRVDGGDRWEKRVLDLPSDAFTFEVGHYSVETIQAGHVNIRLAFDPESEDRRQVGKALQNDTSRRNAQIDFRARGITAAGREEIRQQLRASVAFFEQLFGPYPLDELTVVTVPRDFSQGLPGFISLGTNMMTDPGTEIMDAFRAPVDRRLIVAHEVAHQWWGDKVGTSPNARWIDEAVASYAAGVYGRQLDWKGRYQIFQTTRWPFELMLPEHGTRPIEQMGPVVLGYRLSSSRMPAAAYVWITYEKGALIMDMLAQTIGEQKFQSILRNIVAQQSQKILTTRSFLSELSQQSGRDLRAFSDYFIYGSGVPEIEYRSEVKQEGGKWAIHLTGERVDPWRYRVRVVKRADGKPDVVREGVTVPTAPMPPLVVPLQVALEQPGGKGQGLKYAKKYVDINGGNFKLDIDIPWEPKDVALDRDHEVLALLYSEAHNRKQVLLQRGIHLAALGKKDEAEKTFKDALATKKSSEIESSLNGFGPLPIEMPVGVDLFQWKGRILDFQDEITESALHLALARLYVDEGKDDVAGSELTHADHALERFFHEFADEEIGLLQARIDVHAGSYKAALDRLSKRAKDDPDSMPAEGYALMAVAAKQTGDADALKNAVEHARVLGVDLSAID